MKYIGIGIFLLIGSNCIAGFYTDYNQTNLINWFSGQGYKTDDYQWHLKNTGQPSKLYQNGNYISQEPGGNYDLKAAQGWDIEPNASNVVISIIDSGCDTNHQDLQNVFIKTHGFSQRVINTSSNTYVQTNEFDLITDSSGHGTFIAGLIAGQGIGINGLAVKVKLIGIQTGFNTGEMVQGIYWSITNGANIINLSWTTPTPDLGLSNACLFAASNNVLIVCSVSNGIGNVDISPIYPTSWNFSNVVSVTACTRGGDLYGWSGTNLVMAPGRRVISTFPGNSYRFDTGTSYATPLVASIAALLIEKYPNQSIFAISECIKKSNKPITLDYTLNLPIPFISISNSYLKVNGLPSFEYIIEKSRDLFNWADWTNINGNNSIQIDLTNDMEFFRVRVK